MAGRIPELYQQTPGIQAAVQQRQRTQSDATTAGLSQVFVWPGDAVLEQRTQGNAWTLLEGTHGGFRLRTPSAVLRGVPGASVARPAVLESSARVFDLDFTDAVTLTANSRVVFQNCRFLLPIAVAAGGIIGCVACVFDGTSAITNAGAPGDANRVGCVGSSALAADANVTIIGGI
jgi:hypothetical protein